MRFSFAPLAFDPMGASISMSLAKRNRPKASTETVEQAEKVEPRQLPAGEPEVIEPEEVKPEDVKPLGAHNSPGNTEARAAFLKDEANETIDPEAPSGADGESKKTETLPSMSFEEMAAIATALTNMAGVQLGPKLTKRKDIDWNLSDKESATLEKAYAPVLKEVLADTPVTPMTVLVTVLLSCYVPRALFALGTKPPEEKAPEPPKKVEATVNPAPVEPPKPEPVNAETKAGGYGWK